MRKILYTTLFLIVIFLVASNMIVSGHDDADNHDDDEGTTSDVVLEFIPTFYKDVKPIIADNCMGCHMEGQIASYVSLADDEILKAPQDVAFLTSIRYMPPWMPSRESLPMQHDRSLTDYEIAVIQTWADAGAPVGDEADYIQPETGFALSEIVPSQILTIDEPYLPESTGNDDYRCFAFKPDITEPVYLTGYEFLPDVAEQVHHGILYLVDRSATGSIERQNYADGRIGWSCYTGTNVNSASEEFLGTWTPGTVPSVFPEGTGYWVEPGDIYIVQIHYNLPSNPEADQTSVKLQYADGNSDLKRLFTYELQGPVEIPCPTGVTGDGCDRDVAIQRASELYGGSWLNSRANDLLRGCGQTIADYADNVGENATTFCDFDVPAQLTILGVFGHMHELGVQFQLELNPDTDDSLMVLDIPAWDFHWQDRYQLVEPLVVNRGDVMRMTCTWDNRLSDNPRYIVWGEGTEDEMCFATIMLLEP